MKLMTSTTLITGLKHKVPVGGPASGKGFIQKRLAKKFGKSMHTISTGSLCRMRLEIDPEFRSRYEKLIREGELVPKHEIIAMAENDLEIAAKNPECKFVYWDGVFREIGVIDHFVKKKVITPENTQAFILHASKATCESRYAHRNLNERRPDMGSFHNRFRIFSQHKDRLLDKFRNVGISIHQIDANRDLEDHVGPDVIALAQAFWCDSTNSTTSSQPATLWQSGTTLRRKLSALRTGETTLHM